MARKAQCAWILDGRPTEILPPHPKGHGLGMPEGYESYSGFTFLASPRGELFLFSGQKVVTFDIALDASGTDYRDDLNNVLSNDSRRVRITRSAGEEQE